jgi:PKD repeat protein
MNGDWNLVVYHTQSCDSEITDWSITITYDSSTPDPPPSIPGVTYTGSAFNIAGNAVTTSALNITDSGNIADVNVTMSGSEVCGNQYLDITLQSPNGTTVELTNITTLGDIAFYQTIFDDEASTAIGNGLGPYFGSFQPVGDLSDFDSVEMNGVWNLVVYHTQSCDSEITDWSITIVTTPPLADFSATPTSGDVPLTVQFTDQSIDVDGTVVSWSWNFGDGNTSTDQNPSHTYETYGVYDVILSATDNSGQTGTETKTDYITVNYAGPVWYVSNSGDDSGQGTIGDPFATIGIADYNASDGDTILINEGVYSTHALINKELFIASNNYENLDSTAISNTELISIQFMESSSGSILKGISVKNTDSWTAVQIGTNNGTINVDIESCHIMNNMQTGIYIYDQATVNINNCLIINNLGNGIGGPENSFSTSNLTINNSEISNNSGVGINSYQQYLTINNSIISNNSEFSDGSQYDHKAGIYWDYYSNSAGILTLDNVQIINNNGTGLKTNRSYNNNSTLLSNVIINENKNRGIDGLENATVDSCEISYNEFGGLKDLTNVNIQNSVISHNTVLTRDGGSAGAGINGIETPH